MGRGEKDRALLLSGEVNADSPPMRGTNALPARTIAWAHQVARPSLNRQTICYNNHNNRVDVMVIRRRKPSHSTIYAVHLEKGLPETPDVKRKYLPLCEDSRVMSYACPRRRQVACMHEKCCYTKEKQSAANTNVVKGLEEGRNF